MMRNVVPLVFVAVMLLALPVSATYYVKEPSPLYEVKYTVLSNGTEALVHLGILQWGIDCGMTDCRSAVFGAEEFLLYFNGSRLYLLNFTPVLALSPAEIIYKGATFFNGSWYVEVEYYPQTCSTLVDRFYRLDTEHFCVEPINVNWFWLPKGKVSDSINGWRIELQSLGPGEWGYANVSDLWIALSESASKWFSGPITVPKSSVFPVYFTLERGDLKRNVTLVYLNTTNNSKGLVQGFWFPSKIKIVNVTVCRDVGVRFPLTVVKVDGVWKGNEGALIVIDYEYLSPGMCPEENPLNCTLIPDMVAYYLFYVSSSGPYFLGAYPEEPAVRFENNVWRLKLHLWNGSVENATFNPSCLNASNVSPVKLPNVSLSWKTVDAGRLAIRYPVEFLGFSGNHTVVITNSMVKKVLPYVPFTVGINGKFYPLFRPSNGTLQPVPQEVNPDLSCFPTESKPGKNKGICGPGVFLLLTLISSLFLFGKFER